MEHLEKLKVTHPELVEQYSAMTKEELLNQICAEVLDLHAMDDRVQLFMNECTNGMSKTNYTLESLKTLINTKQEMDIAEFCADEIEQAENDEELLKAIHAAAIPK